MRVSQLASHRMVVIAMGISSALENTSCTRDRPAGSTRTPDDDVRCEATSMPQAYAFADQAAAERAGCRAVRVYARKTPESGPSVDDERWVFCCPKR
jgi:hypothetical protein